MTDGPRRLIASSGGFFLRMFLFLGLIQIAGTIGILGVLSRPDSEGVDMVTAVRRTYTLVGAATAAGAFSLGAWAGSRKALDPQLSLLIGLAGWSSAWIMFNEFWP